MTNLRSVPPQKQCRECGGLTASAKQWHTARSCRNYEQIHRRNSFSRLLAGGPLAAPPRRPGRRRLPGLLAGDGRRRRLVHVPAAVLQQLPHHESVLQVVAGIKAPDVTCIECHFPPRPRRRGPRQNARAGAGGQVHDRQRRPPPHRRSPRRQLPAVRLPRDAAVDRAGRFPRHPFRPHSAPQPNPPRKAVALHQLPQPDRARGAHDGDEDDLLPLPFQGPAAERRARRMHALPTKSPRGSSTSAAA